MDASESVNQDVKADEEIGNRERILNVAEQLFATNGYDATSVREIVNAASVTSPMLYYYFGSKEDLLKTLLTERIQSFEKRIDDYTRDARSTEDICRGWCSAIVDETTDSSGSLRFVMALLYGPCPDSARACLLAQVRQMREMFETMIHRFHPNLSSERIAFVREMIFNMLDPYMFPVIDGWVDNVGDDVIDAIVARLSAMLADDLPIPEKTLKRNAALLTENIERLQRRAKGERTE